MFNNPQSRPPTRIKRWLTYLQQFDFTVMYSPGKENTADYLSWYSISINAKDQKTSTQHEDTVKVLLASVKLKAMSLE